MPQGQSGRSVLPLLFGGILVVAGLGLTIYNLLPSGRDAPGDGQPSEVNPGENIRSDGANDVSGAAFSSDDLRVAIEAVASAEDADFERSLELWRGLAKQFPDESIFRVNEAVTVLKWINETNNKLTSGTVSDPIERAELEQDLNEAYSKAGAIVDSLASLESVDGRTVFLQAALISAEAQRLSNPAADEMRLKAAELLAKRLSEDPAQPLLACELDDLVEVFGQGNEALQDQRREALYASWKQKPRNLYLLRRCMLVMLDAEDPRIVELLDPSVEFTESMWSMVQRDVDRLKPKELVERVRAAVEAGDWKTARRQRIQLWMNVVTGMSGFQPDFRLTNPDIMALLDASFLNRLSRELPTVAQPVKEAPKFNFALWAVEADAIAWFDFDLDLDFDLVVTKGSELSVYVHNEDELLSTPVQVLDLGFAVSGLLVGEFFTVDTPNRSRVVKSVAELMEQEANGSVADTGSSGDESISSSARHDTYQELVLWGEDGVKFVAVDPDGLASNEVVQVLDTPAGTSEITGVVDAAVLDFESDGDLDLVCSTKSGLRILQNNGNRTFEDVSAYSDFSALAGEGERLQLSELSVCDLDADLDLDIVAIAAATGQVVLVENLLHGQFRARLLDDSGWAQGPSLNALAVAELDGNSSWDVIVGSANAIDVTLTRTPAPGEIVPLQSRSYSAGGNALAVGDFNSDGFLDALVGSNRLQVMLGGVEGFGEGLVLEDIQDAVSSLEIVDCNQDRILDFAAIVGGQVVVGVGDGEAKAASLAVRVRGINDVNGGGRVNHFAIGTTLEIWSDSHQQRRVVDSPVTHFGLGSATADNLRIIFPNGLTQNLESPAANALVEERQELKGSCPFVYGWNGERFELITDLLWNAPLGLQVARGQVMPDRRWEYLVLPGELMQPKGDSYELRVTEELWEFAYFDHIQLTAVDHPAETRVFSNEKVGPPSIAQPMLFEVAEPIYPTSAKNQNGRELLEELRTQDSQYAQAFDAVICQGLVEPHFVELEFDDLPADQPLALFLTGWMHPTDTSLNIGIATNPDRIGPEPPSLWTVDENGDWQCSRPFMGFPGGKPKSIVVDLDGVWNSDDRRIRIASSQQIFWDEAFISPRRMGVDTELVEQPIPLKSAELRYRGFSELLPREFDQPHWYDYENVSPFPKWQELEGPFTRFGSVSDLLSYDDDRMVVMASGDEISLRFEMPKKSLPNGWRRDFVLHCVGWDKDADLNTLAGQTSLPLPFKAQKNYPPSVEQSLDSEEAYRKNRESLTRKRQVRRSTE